MKDICRRINIRILLVVKTKTKIKPQKQWECPSLREWLNSGNLHVEYYADVKKKQQIKFKLLPWGISMIYCEAIKDKEKNTRFHQKR